MAEKVITPIVHMNGDRKATLMRNLEAAYRATRAALVALQECSPNSRNYYPEPGRYDQALTQHIARFNLLEAVRDSLLTEATQLDAETPGRA